MALKKYQRESLMTLEENDFLKRARTGIYNFTKFTKPDYERAWHNQTLARYLNRFVARQIPRLMVFTPPRHGKSEKVSRRLPAYLLGLDPKAQIILNSFSGDLAGSMNVDVQRIMDSPEYRMLFPNTLINDENSKRYGNLKRSSNVLEVAYMDGDRLRVGGGIRATGIGGSITGRGGDWIIIDDPVKNWEEAQSPTQRDKVHNFYTSTLYTRREKNASILLTMTRWHEDDLAGRLLKHAQEDPNADQWTILNLPAISEEGSGGIDDIRAIGEALWPWKYPIEELQKIRASVGVHIWPALYQQRPVADGGSILKRVWWKFYDEMPKDVTRVVQ